MVRSSASLQCLSALGPMRTFTRGLIFEKELYRSPVPFGVGSYADAHTIVCAGHSGTYKSPVPFGVGSYADNEALFFILHCVFIRSPVPFGVGSYADLHPCGVVTGGRSLSLQCLSALGPMRTLRRSVLEDRIARLSPVPFGVGSYADTGEFGPLGERVARGV